MGAHAKTVYQIEQLEAMLLLPIHRPFKVAEGAILSPGGDRQGRLPYRWNPDLSGSVFYFLFRFVLVMTFLMVD